MAKHKNDNSNLKRVDADNSRFKSSVDFGLLSKNPKSSHRGYFFIHFL
jgi:hypothetical protein